MLTIMLPIAMFLLAVVGAVRPLTQMTWRSVLDRRIDKHLSRSRELTCPVLRDFHERKATQGEWSLQALSRFKNHRSVGLATAAMVVAAAGLLIVTYPPIAESVDVWIASSLILLFFVAGISYIHALHCLSLSSVNRTIFAALRGRQVVPVLNPPSLVGWLLTFRGGFKALATVTGLEVLTRAAEVQRQEGRQWVPDFMDQDDAQKYAHRLDDESVRKAVDWFAAEGVLGGATLTP